MLAGLAAACGRGAASSSPEEAIELARAKADAAEVLRAALLSSDAGLSVRLRAFRGLVEAGRLDRLRSALRQMPAEQAHALVAQAVPNLTWLAMAGSVPDGRLRQAQVSAKDALLLLAEWMTPDEVREARSVAVRWFVQDLPERAGKGEMSLARAGQAVRAEVMAAATLVGFRRWNDPPAVAALVLAHGTDADRLRLRAEAVREFVRAPFGTPRERAEVRGGILAALRGLSGDAAALKAGASRAGDPQANLVLADLVSLRDALAAVVRSPSETVDRRVAAVAKLQEVGFALRPLDLGGIVADASAAVELRAALARPLAEEGDGAAAAAAVLATEPEVFAAVEEKLRHVKIAGEVVPFARGVAAQTDRLASLPGRCAALVAALADMGPVRSATAAELLLDTGDPFVVSLGVQVLARVGTGEHVPRLAALGDSRATSACWPDETLGTQVQRALEAIEARGGVGPAAGPGEDDGG